MHFFSQFFHILALTGVWRLTSSLHTLSWTAFTDIEYAGSNWQGSVAAGVSRAMPCQ